MRNYEITFIVDPVLSSDEIESTAQSYVKHLKSEGCEVVHLDDIGLRQLAYPIKKRTSGVYYCIEFKSETGSLIPDLKLAMKRDERIIRYLAIRLNKYGVEYNAEKRAGNIPTMEERRKLNEQKKKAEEERKAAALSEEQ